MSILHPLLQPYKPTDADPFDATKAAHLLNRAGFGGRHDEISRVVGMGPEKAVDWLLDFPDANADEQSKTDIPNLSMIEGYPKDFNEIRRMLNGKTEEEKKALREKFQMANREAMQATVAWWLKRMAYGPHPLQEKLTLFWHGHFTTSAKDERAALLMWDQNELLRRSAAGNFAKFVHAVSHDPAMIDYLNNSQNHKNHPNENYAREVMELFTLGIGNYTEDDIKQAARAFTGWSHEGDEFVFHRGDHDDGVKTFFGYRGNLNGDDVLDIILKQPVCAKYIASRLYKFFINEAVDDTLAAVLGNLLRDSNYELRPLLRTMLSSKAFYTPEVVGSQIKSPIQLVIGTIRMLDLEMPPGRSLEYQMGQMGQLPFAPPNVKGWPGGRMWINTSTLFVRYNTAVFLAGGTVPAAPNRLNKKDAAFLPRRNLQGQQVNFQPAVEPGDAEAVVDYWLDRLIQRPVDPSKRGVLLNALGNQPDNPQTIRKMVQLIVSMPEYQLC